MSKLSGVSFPVPIGSRTVLISVGLAVWLAVLSVWLTPTVWLSVCGWLASCLADSATDCQAV